MNQINKIAVLGGSGRTGKYLVTQLLAQGYSLKLLIRHPDNFQLKSSDIEIIQGDALNPATIHSLLSECSAVISTIGQRPDEPLVASQATINILKAMASHQISRYILVAGINIDTPFDKKGHQTLLATQWMKDNFPLIQADRQNAYSILSESALKWTMVRVPFIEFTDTRNQVVVDLKDCMGNRISAADIAAFLIEQLTDTTFIRASPFISNA